MITKKRLEIIQRKYNREYTKYYIINNDMFEYCISNYLINLSNYIISNYINKKIENVYINYNELEKSIILKNNKDNILKITVYNQYLKFFYNNNTYIIKDIKIFIDFIENFFNNIENLKNFKIAGA